MSHSKWDIPPKKDDALFDDYILDLHHQTFGLGPDTTGILDDDNISFSLGGYILADGTIPLTADWDAGAFDIRAETFESDVATGTAPIIVASATKVNNLNADQLDSLDSTAFFILAGQSGGQIAYGGTDSGDDLLFHSTSNSTLGLIAFTSLTKGLIWDGEKKALAIGEADFSTTIGGTTKDSTFTIHNTGGSNAYDLVFHRHSATSGTFLAGARSRGSAASPSIVQNGDNLLDIFGIAHDGDEYQFAASIMFDVDGTPGVGDMPGKIRFLATPSGSGTPADIMEVCEDGLKFQNAKFVILDKASGNGIKVDTTTPTFGFADLIGDQFAKNTGATKPSLTTYNGVIQSWQFAASDEAFMTFHIPHDYVLGTEIFLHIHWSHIGTLVTGGTITFKATSIYAKAHNQAAFTSSPAVGTFTGTASTVQYQQILSETSYSASSPSGLQVDTDLLEPDGVIEMTFEVDANDITVSSGGVPDPFIHYVDIHYRTTGLIGTKDKVPDFYS